VAQEISFTLDWSTWVPIVIAAASLALTTWQMRRKNNQKDLQIFEQKIDRAIKLLKECEENLKHRGRENDALRREKFALLEQIARLTSGQQE
jgi:cytochrome oxidase assembly protein ShyY1